MKRRIAVFTGTRAEYGLLRPLLSALRGFDGIELSIIASGSHLSPEFGDTYREIEGDGFRIDEKVDMLLSADTPSAICSSMGLCVIGCGSAFARLKPELLVLLGDRYECLCAALAASVSSIPIAHIHGGESTEGALDDSFRHAITKLAFLHFASTEAYRRRIIQLGEDPARVFAAGALGLDNVRSLPLLPRDAILRELGLPDSSPLFVVTFHPATAEPGTAASQFGELSAALAAFPDAIVVFTKANADEGGRAINALVEREIRERPGRRFLFASLGSLRYLSLLGAADAVIGNSSSGIIEAPSLGLPTVDIGDRQKGRIRAPSVIHAAPEAPAIGICCLVEAELAALAPEDRKDYLASMGIDEPAFPKIIRTAFSLLNRVTYFTVGEDEVKAWVIPAQTKAPKAAAAIHKDFERGFIKAEVCAYDDFMACGKTLAGVKAAGKLRLEGKDYIVKDGDIITFRFNV